MRIQVASDLHLEFLERQFPRMLLVEPEPGAQALILAGDIHNHTKAVAAFRDWPVPVVMVAGNHEFYGHAWEQTRVDLRRACESTNIIFLDNESVIIDGVRFLGSTLWTGFDLQGQGRGSWMRDAGRGINDYQVIRTQSGLLTPQETLGDHLRSRAWLERELATPFDGKTVVISHTPPHPIFIAPAFVGSRLNGAFASDLTPLLLMADAWLCGHVHHSVDVRVAGCRMVANPAGYPLNIKRAASRGELKFENPDFNPGLVIDTDMLKRVPT